MGDYNPHSPVILGQEWPGIRDENTQFSPPVDVVEYGHTFRTASAYVLQDGRFYVHEMPANTASEVYVFALYPNGDEAETGPIRRVVIPAETVYVTGATVSSGTAESALFTPEISNYILLDTDPTVSQITTGFNTAPYTVLDGKRIVGVNLLYAAHRFFNTEDRDIGPFIYLADATYPFGGGNLIYDSGNSIAEGGSLAGDQVLRVKFGDVCRLWQSPATSEILPWNFSDIQRFDGGAATRLYATIVTGSSFSAPAGGICYVWYMALEVLFCEETRVAVGGLRRGMTGSDLTYGANPIRLRSLARVLNPSLAAGDWTATLAAADQGGAEPAFSGYPDLNALRELYALPTHEGVKINVTDVEGEVFTRESTNILTQLSVHASGAPLTEVHAYGRIVAAPVYGAYVAEQDIYDDTVVAGTNYSQIRFYARRFGNTSQQLDCTAIGGAGAFATSITPGDFDELAEIVDGWKEVTLTSAAPAVLGGLAGPGVRWASAAETAGNRWEILGVAAPAVSGIPGNLLNLVPSPHQLTSATYQPPDGTGINMTWASPTASGSASVADSTADVVFMFSLDPPTITDISVTTGEQAVTGIGEGCAGTPCCIPTDIYYNRVTWSAASGTVSGDYLGAIELQRLDLVTDWQTIMSASSQGVTGFNDYEARVGQPSVYRVRATNLYGFAGAWSAQVTGTVTSPGVDLECNEDGTAAGTLIFTSNSVQSGARNLAYVMQFDRSVEEAFSFPEAATTRLRRRYGRDFFTAFRPTERGGEQFSRVVLVQAAAGALPNMANIRSLRDLAWGDLPYVCVRDERGNRWFANVVVPDVNIAHRSSYFARVDISEVTDTACEVDP